MPTPLSIRPGRIIYTWMRDRNGYGKLRPAVIISIAPGDGSQLVVMALTTTFHDPPPESHVSVPWHPRGHPVTRLTRRSAAVTHWLDTIHPEDIVGFGGELPAVTMRLVSRRLDDLQPGADS